MLAKKTMEALTPGMGELADAIGVAYSTVKFWKAGDRNPGPENARKLADLADRRAEELLILAGRLRAEAREESGG